MNNKQTEQAFNLLKQLIATPSLSKKEEGAAMLIENFLEKQGIKPCRIKNNVIAKSPWFDDKKPVLLLNSHIDTVPPASGYTIDPYIPLEKENKIFGLGSNDAGAPLVSLLIVFTALIEKEQPYNLLFSATAEEEISGENGIKTVLKQQNQTIDLAIVGEPTQMQMATSEKGLLVLDCFSYGKSGHAARNEGINSIYKSLKDIEWFKNYCFKKISPQTNAVKMTVTQINAGSAHNVIPDKCHFVVDVRPNDCYSNTEILKIINEHVECEITPRSTHLNSSAIDPEHPVVKRGISLGLKSFSSPTLSDRVHMNFPSLKIGPGKSERSHSADEFIYKKEIEQGIEMYFNLLNNLKIPFYKNEETLG